VLGSVSLLGESAVDITPSSGGTPIPEYGYVPSTKPKGSLADITESASTGIEQIAQLVQDVRAGKGTVGKLMTDQQLYDSLNAFVSTAADVTSALKQGRGTVGKLLNDPATANALERSMTNLEEMTRRINAGEGSIGKLLKDEAFASSLNGATDNIRTLTAKINSGEGTVGKLIYDDKAYNQVVSTLDSIKGGVDTLSGTLGAINKFKIDLDLQGYYLPSATSLTSPDEEGAYQNAFRLDIDPQDKKHLYRVGVTSSPFGKRRDKTQTITETGPDGIPRTTTIHTLTSEQSYQVTGLLGFKAPYDARLWGGLIEGTGGAEVDYPLPILNRKLLLSFEAFDFNRPNNQSAHLRLMGRYQFHPNLYLVGGYDDPLENHSFFLGGGIRWTDENIKYLLGALGGAVGR